MAHENIASILAEAPLFSEMDTGDLERVATGGQILKVPKGRILFNKGDTADGFYVVVDGRIKVSFVSRDGKEYIAEIFGPKQSFGEAVMFLGKPYPVCAQAIADSRLLYISKKVVFDCVDHNSGFARRIIAGLCARLIDRMHALEFLTVYSSIQKVIGYLLRGNEPGDTQREQTDVVLPVNKAMLAAQLNLTPETLSRVFHRLIDEGLICVQGKTIHICDIKRLREYDG